MRFHRFAFGFCIVFNFWSQTHSDSATKPLKPELYFDLDDPQWLSFIGQFAKGINHCSLNTEELNSVRVCARAQFYGPAGLETMKHSGALYSEDRNDKMLVLVSGCIFCPSGFKQNELTIKLVQLLPEGSMLTSCYQQWVEVSATKLLTPINSSDPIPFIIGGVFSERRCSGLFSTDELRMHFYSHYLLLEGVNCSAHNSIREIPLQGIHTEDYENRAMEYVFARPLDLSRTDRILRMTQIWGVPPERSPRPKFSDIDCGRVLANDVAYVAQRKLVSYDDPDDDLSVDCASIRSRYRHFDLAEQKYQQGGNGTTDYPLAFNRIVFKDYLFIEMEFASSYAPQNYYCYSIDKKSSYAFHRQIHALATCFPNVLVVPIENEYELDSKGHNFMKSAIECMKLLLAKDNWKYVIILQNHDVQIKTNDELVQIFKWLNGVNDIQYTRIGSANVNFAGKDWSLSHLKLFKNATKNSANLELKKNKGQAQMSLTREFVEWLLNELDVTILLDQLNSYTYGNDEIFIPTLAANEFMEAPGGFTQKCFDKELAPGLTRMTIWDELSDLCHSGIMRHSICIFGLKDLVPHLSGRNPSLFANKMMLEKDADAVQCWHNTMFNRTYIEPTLDRLNKSFYVELPQVRYNLEKRRQPHGTFNADTFNCRYAFINEVKQYQELRGEYANVAKHFKSAEEFEFCDAIHAEAEGAQTKQNEHKMVEENNRSATTECNWETTTMAAKKAL